MTHPQDKGNEGLVSEIEKWTALTEPADEWAYSRGLLLRALTALNAERREYCGTCGQNAFGPICCCLDDGAVLPNLNAHEASAVRLALKRNEEYRAESAAPSNTATVQIDERAEFEAYILTERVKDYLKRACSCESFDYENVYVQEAWEAWQARAALTAKVKP